LVSRCLLYNKYVYGKRASNVLKISSCFYEQPYNATRINASSIEDRVSELLKENGNVDGKGGFWEEFEVGSFNKSLRF
jgi:hypothetical protein